MRSQKYQMTKVKDGRLRTADSGQYLAFEIFQLAFGFWYLKFPNEISVP